MKHRSIPILNLVVMLSMLLGAVATPAAAAAPATSSGSNLPAQQTDLSGPVQVEEQLRSQMMADEATGYLIYFRAEPDLSPALKMTWEERGKWTVKMLQETAKESQVRVIEYLDKQKAEYKAYWIDNVIVVNASSRSTFNGLQSFGEIEILRARRHPNFYEPVEMSDVMANLPQTVQSNLTHVGADQVWAMGVTGQGIVVANIDTGVNYTHEALVQQYRGNLGGGVFNHDHNWYDPASGGTHLLVPADWHDHGSHTMGTMLGSTDPTDPANATTTIGMAPGAKWIACRAFEATDQELLDCGQFMAAPTEVDGVTDPDPDLRPNIINNSWGECVTTHNPWYDGVLNSWHALGIYPVFSNGNSSNCGYPSPPGLNTVGSPARAGNVTGVGATGRNNGVYATFSNWGPTDQNDTINPMGYPRLKPQVVAPGTNYSAYNTGNDYGDMSGTSMSSPHVVGLVALMWSAASCLVGNYAATETIIQQTANPIPYDTGGTPAPGPGNVPNYATGWGEINAPAAVEAAQGSCGPQGVLEGRVVKQSNPSEGIAGATVEATLSPTQTYTIEAGPDGSFSKVVFTGVYTVTASAYAYLPETVTGVSVTEGMTTTMSDIALEAAPSYVVSGFVKDARTGWPLYAQIVVEGAPIPPVWSDPLTGAYTVNLLGGSVFALKATNFWGGYLESNVPVGPLTGDLTQDILLEPNVVACNAPGYLMHGLNEGFDLTSKPAGWTVTHVSGACDWAFNDPGSRGNLTGGAGNFAVADSDECGSGTTMNTILTSPKVDLSTLSQIMLSFKYDYNNLSTSEVAKVEVSDDGGATWTQVVSWNTDQRGPATFTQDVTSLLSGAIEAQVRFTYVAPGWDWWWEIDDVFLGLNDCAPQPGGLVVGSVEDLNTSLPLLGATVGDGLSSTQTVSTPLDPNVPDAFYTLFSPAGLKTITASMPLYTDGVAGVTVPLSGTVGQDYSLAAGLITYTPASMDVTLLGGGSTTLPLTITNSGTYTASISLEEIDKGSLPYGLNAVDLAWVSESPATFEIGPGEDVVVDVNFDANIAPGIYNGEIKFNTGTPYPVANMPIKLTVQVPPGWGKVMGTVSTMGACDVNPAVLANVPVTITSETDATVWSLTTDSQGIYYQWIDESKSPVTIEVNVPGYLPGLYTSVPIVAGQSIAKDFALRQLAPCFSVTPPSLEVTLGLGQNTTRQVKATNSGAATGVFTTTESGGSFTPGMSASGEVTIGDLIKNPNPPMAAYGQTARPAPMADSVTITQSSSQAITSGNSVACGVSASGYTVENSYFRVFDLDSFGLTSGFDVTNVEFGIESAVGSQQIGVNLYLLTGATLTWANLTPIGSATSALASQSLTYFSVPVTGSAPAGSKLVVEIHSPDGSAAVTAFYIGSNAAAETGPSYLAASGCGITEPTTTADIGFPNMHIVMNVTGTRGGGTVMDLPWLTENPTTSAVMAETFQWIDIGFDASKVALPGTYKGIVNFNTDDSENPVIPVNVTMHVQASALWGQLEGNVEATGRCDLDQEALANADLTIVGTDGITRTVTADGDGYYLIWLPSSASPFTVTASKDGYFPDSEGGIVVNSGGALTTAPLLVMRQDVPCVDYNPDGISITLPWGGTGSDTLNLTNIGPAASAFTIFELPLVAGNYLIVGSAGTNVTAIQNALTALGHTSTLISTTTFNGQTVAQLLAYRAVIWTTSLTPTSASLPKMTAFLDAGGRLMVFYNDFAYSWRNTAAPNFFTTYFESLYGADAGSDGPITGVDIMAGINTDITADPYPDSFKNLGPHATGIFANTSPKTDWAGVRVARNLYRAVYFGFNLNYVSPAADQTLIMQRVTEWLVVGGDVPWLSEVPVVGTIPADTGNVPVTVNFNAGVAAITQPGDYHAALVIENQDEGNNPMTVPVTMTVLPDPTWGVLNGTISGLLYCDGTPGTPLSNASVQIVPGPTLTTDANGNFHYWLAAGNYTLNVSAANYLAQTGISVIVTGGVTTTQDVSLRWLRPCVNAAPTSLEATLNLGASTTLPFTLTNTGAAATPFKIKELTSGFTPFALGHVLVVSENSTADTAMEAALTALGYTYQEVTASAYTAMSVSALIYDYDAVLYVGIPSAGSEQDKTIAYLDAGGRLLVTDNDLGYSVGSSVFYTTYLEADYGVDAGSDGTITGQDIMAGLSIDISSDPYPDNFTITGPNAVAIFTNDAPKTDLAGLRIERNSYKAVYLAWDFQYTNGTADTATKLELMSRVMNYLAPSEEVPWLSETPITGTLAADTGVQVVNVTMDASLVNQPGVYTAEIQVKTQDPVNPVRIINVTMTVPLDPNMGKLNGVVYDLGACDINPVPLANAAVNLTDGAFNWTTFTDAAGYYQFWVSTTAPLTVTATADEHLPEQAVVSVPQNITVTQDLELRWIKPCIDANPDSLSATLTYGMTTTKVLSLTNSGPITGTFLITPHTEGFIPTTVGRPATVTIGDVTFAQNPNPSKAPFGQTALPANPLGSVTITHSSSQDIVSGNSAACWNSSIGYSAENSYLRVFDLASFGITDDLNVVSVDFGIEDAVGSQPIDVRLYTLNGPDLIWANLTLIGSASGVLSPQALTHFSIPVTGTAPAGSKLVVEVHSPDGSAAVTRLFIGSNAAPETAPSYIAAATCGITDPVTTAAIGFPDMHIVMSVTGTTGGGGGGPANYPWLTTNPVTGTVPAAGATAVDVIFDSTKVPQPGVYTGYLLVENDTPVYDPITVPVTMTVTVPAGWSKLQGVVQSLGYCDVNPTPLEDATIFIEGTGGYTVMLKTAADGSYQYWMPSSTAPLTVTASNEAGFEAVTVTNVQLGPIPTTQNFDLRSYEPCISTNPTSYEVTVVRGGTLTSPLELFNDGALGTDYEFSEVNGGFIPARPGALLQSAAPAPAFAKRAPVQVGFTSPSFIPLGADLITEGFEDATFPPPGWTSVVNDPGYTWMIGTYSPHSGTQYADIVYDDTLAQQDEWLLSPELNLTSGVLSLWSYGSLDWCKVTYDNCDLNVWLVVGDVGGGDDILVGVADDAWTANWTWAQSTWNLDALLPGGPVRIGLQYYGMDGAEVAVDDVLLNGETGGGPGGDVPWLSVSPITGTLASDSSQNATVLFDTTVLTQTGQYSATLYLNTDDAQHPELPVPVTLNVIAPTYAVSLEADPLIQVGDRGAWVTHQVTVTNNGDDPYGDLFTFSTSGNGWITNVPAPILMMPGESAVVDVDVFIPAGAMPGSVDNVTVKAQSSDPAVFAEIALTTVARSFAPVMTPPTGALTGVPGTQVSYTLHLVNAGTYTDSYLLTIGGNGWTTNLSTPIVTLAPGESIDIVVTVTIPLSALEGDQDMVTITAISLLDMSKTVQSVLTTTAAYLHLYLPMVTQ